jgi:hypothetical protein
MRAKLKEIKENLRRLTHQAIPEQGRWLAQVIRGYFAKAPGGWRVDRPG